MPETDTAAQAHEHELASTVDHPDFAGVTYQHWIVTDTHRQPRGPVSFSAIHDGRKHLLALLSQGNERDPRFAAQAVFHGPPANAKTRRSTPRRSMGLRPCTEHAMRSLERHSKPHRQGRTALLNTDHLKKSAS